MVDIDTSGPGAEVELPAEDKTFENEVEVSNETIKNSVEYNDSTEKSDEQPAVQEDTTTNQEPSTEEQKKELDDYSEVVNRRIAKLTKKMREAERIEAAAL